MRVRVLIRPKEGILDPQGKAVERALPALGFEGVSHVRIGRLVELEAESSDRIDELCEQLLANPLIEDYEIETLPDTSESPAAPTGASPAAPAAQRRRPPSPRPGVSGSAAG